MSALREYADSLPKIYQELLRQFPRSDPHRTVGSGLAMATIYADLKNQYRSDGDVIPYSSGLVREAFEQMAAKGVVEVRNKIFVYPQPLGEELIELLSGMKPETVPPFPAPPIAGVTT
jgi:hypothetical protein